MSEADLHNVQWHTLEVSPESIASLGEAYWENIKKCQPVIGISAIKP
ncbi:MAG: hypothetical protein ABI844_10435 [Saprospiraceae bacterium]